MWRSRCKWDISTTARWSPAAVSSQVSGIRRAATSAPRSSALCAARPRPFARPLRRRGPTPGFANHPLRELAFGHAAETVDDATYLERAAALRRQRDALADGEGPAIPAARIVAWLRAFGAAIERSDLPAEQADLIHAVYERIIVAGPIFVNARLTTDAYQHGMALALPQVVMARPTGVGRGTTTYAIPIEGGMSCWPRRAGA